MFALVCTPLMAAWLSNLSKARSVMAHRVFGKLEAGKQWAVLWNLMCTTGSILLASLFFNAIEEWDFSDAVYFSFISITTIGYGDLAPVTPIGRCVFLIFYISSVAWASVLVGALHKYFSKHFFHAIRSCCRGWGDILIPLVAALWLALGSFLFQFLEGWSFADSMYYCVITMSTVGYGDFAPVTKAGRLSCCLFFAMGLPLLFVALARIAASPSAQVGCGVPHVH